MTRCNDQGCLGVRIGPAGPGWLTASGMKDADVWEHWRQVEEGNKKREKAGRGHRLSWAGNSECEALGQGSRGSSGSGRPGNRWVPQDWVCREPKFTLVTALPCRSSLGHLSVQVQSCSHFGVQQSGAGQGGEGSACLRCGLWALGGQSSSWTG